LEDLCSTPGRSGGGTEREASPPASHVEDCLRELEKAGKGVVAVNDRIECGRGKERTSRQ
jgi:hypothetical protein